MSADVQLYRPGSSAAVVVGCICPQVDNGRGDVELARSRGGWCIDSACGLHGSRGTYPAIIPAPALAQSGSGSKPIATGAGAGVGAA